MEWIAETSSSRDLPPAGWRERFALRVIASLVGGSDEGDSIRTILKALREESGLSTVTIRIREADDFPLYVLEGDGEALVRMERDQSSGAPDGTSQDALPHLDGLCSAVIRGQTALAPACFTPRGSLFVGRLRTQLQPVDLAMIARCRGCPGGPNTQTFALIPLRQGEATIGLLEVRDPRPDLLSAEDISFLEDLAGSLARALARLRLPQVVPDLETRRQVVSDAAGELLFLMARDGAILDFFSSNPAQLYTAPENFLGKRVQDVLPEGPGELTIQAIRRALERRQLQAFEYTLELPGQGPRRFEARIVPSGPDRVLSVARDITQLKQTQDALRASERRFAKAFRASPVAMSITRAVDGRILEVNEAFERFSGYRPDEALDRSTNELQLWAEPGARARFLSLLKSQRRCKSEQMLLRRKDGELRTVLVSAEVFELDGEPCVLSAAEDVTDRLRIEAELSAREEIYRSLVELCPDAIWVYRGGQIELVNEAAVALFGAHRREDLLGKSPLDLVHADSLPLARARMLKLGAERGRLPPIEERLRRLDGSSVLAEVAAGAVRLSGGDAVQVIARDLTQRRRGEELLHLLQRSIDVAPTAAFWIAPSGRFVHVNEAACESLGYTNEELLTMTVFEVNPNTRPETWGQVWEEFRLAKAVRRETSHRRKDGTIFPIEVFSAFISFEDREYLAGFALDITERKRAEEALRESERRLRTVAENAPDTILQVDRRGIITYINRLSPGQMPDRALGSHVTEWVPADQRATVAASLEAVFSTGDPQEYEVTGPRHGDEERFYRVRVRPVGNPGQAESCIYTATDITELKRAEEERHRLQAQLAQAQKMEAIGTLAGGIAHDFNNMLGGILAGLSAIDLSLGPTFQLHDELVEMQALVGRGADLTKQLLGFARRGKYDATPTVLAEVLQATSKMFSRTRKDIVLSVHTAPELARVLGDKSQLEQTFLNLFLNAGQAMPGGGNLTVAAENVELSAADTSLHGCLPGRYVKIAVADTGVGMDAETRQRAFEPFFTTRAVGQGSGLGLASVFGIVKHHGGFVTVDSEPGRGSTFSVYLPATDRPIPPSERSTQAPRPGKETILLVDDEEHVARTVGRLLTMMGYGVLVANSGRQALELYRDHKERVSLVVLDLVMPGMSGGETFDALREIDPTVKVLLSSGYSVEGQASEILERGCNGFIQKPFSVSALSAKLKQLLSVS